MLSAAVLQHINMNTKILVYVYMKAGADHAIEDISRRLRVNCHTHYNVSE